MKINNIALALLLGGLMMNGSVLANHNADHRIRKAVDSTIDKYPNLDDDLNIKVKDACVILTGEVEDESEKQLATQVISAIDEVKEVDNRLEVETGSTCSRK
jgi:osmotically-inducible protein OsmY